MRLRSCYGPAEQSVRPAPRSDFNAAPVDSVQNTRLDALEQMVRTLGLDLQNERKLVATVLQDVQRESGVPRDDAGQPSSRHDERQHTPPADLAPLFDRLMAMERTLQAVLLANQRTSELLTEKIASLGTRSGGVDLTPIINRLDIIEEAVLSRDGDPHASLSERLDALDEQLTAERLRSTEAQSALLAELSTVKGQLERQRGEIAVAILTPLTDRVNGLSAAIEGRDEDVARDFTTVKERLAGVEKGFAAAAEKTTEVVQAATTRAAEAQKTHTLELGEVHEALMKLNANQHTLAGSVEQWRRDGSTALGGLGDRMLSLTTNLDGIGTRLQGVEKEAGRPMQMLEAMSGTMDNMHKVTVERYYRRNRFWYWLFGTDDWVASSWPSHAQRIAEDLKSVKAVARAKA